MQANIIKIPNLVKLTSCFKLKLNPNYESILKFTNLWIRENCGNFTDEALSEDRAKLYAMAYPKGSLERLKAIASLYNCIFMFDDTSDKSPGIAKKGGKLFLDLMENAELKVECEFGKIAKE